MHFLPLLLLATSARSVATTSLQPSETMMNLHNLTVQPPRTIMVVDDNSTVSDNPAYEVLAGEDPPKSTGNCKGSMHCKLTVNTHRPCKTDEIIKDLATYLNCLPDWWEYSHHEVIHFYQEIGLFVENADKISVGRLKPIMREIQNAGCKCCGNAPIPGTNGILKADFSRMYDHGHYGWLDYTHHPTHMWCPKGWVKATGSMSVLMEDLPTDAPPPKTEDDHEDDALYAKSHFTKVTHNKSHAARTTHRQSHATKTTHHKGHSAKSTHIRPGEPDEEPESVSDGDAV